MNREDILEEILALLIAKRNYRILLCKMTDRIDKQAKLIGLSIDEKTQLILKANEIVNNGKNSKKT